MTLCQLGFLDIGQWQKSGLTRAVLCSETSIQQADKAIAKFVRTYTAPKTAHLAGNSVHMDLRFIEKYMPTLAAHLHYRIVDVSTVKELAKRWYPRAYTEAPQKQSTHRYKYTREQKKARRPR